MSSQPNQSLIDGIRCFQELTTREEPIGTKDLAEHMGINVTRVNRLLKTLTSIGMAQQDSQKKYMPGPAVHLFAAQSFHSSKLFRVATKIAMGCDYNDRTLAIGLLWNESVVYMYHALPEQNPSEGLGGYRMNHIANSSIGQALFAEHGDEEIEAIVENWDKTLSDSITENISVIRENGYAALFDENGILLNVALVFSVGSTKAAVAFSDLQFEKSDVTSLVEELREIKHRIESIEI